MRLTTGLGIALGGVGGALAALMGAPRGDVVAEPVNGPPTASRAVEPGAEGPKNRGVEDSSPIVSATPSASVAAASASASTSAEAPPPAPAAAPSLNVPATQAELNKAMLYCDQKKDFDECTRVAQAFDLGSAGRVDAEQAKRFRKIALTHLVSQCETGNSPHACYVLAAKYRAGTELTQSTAGAEALEKRALELCRFRSAPECPAR